MTITVRSAAPRC